MEIRVSHNINIAVQQNKTAKNAIKLPQLNSDSINITNGSNVSFSGTCEYCGCQTYSGSQIDNYSKLLLNMDSEDLVEMAANFQKQLKQSDSNTELAKERRNRNYKHHCFWGKFKSKCEAFPQMSGREILVQKMGYEDNDKTLQRTIKAMLSQIMTTEEHIIPHQSKGQLTVKNKAYTCQCCNNIKGHKSFKSFLNEYPEIKMNLSEDKVEFALQGDSKAKIKTLMTKSRQLGAYMLRQDNALNKLLQLKINSDESKKATPEIKEEIKQKQSELKQLHKIIKSLEDNLKMNPDKGKKTLPVLKKDIKKKLSRLDKKQKIMHSMECELKNLQNKLIENKNKPYYLKLKEKVNLNNVIKSCSNEIEQAVNSINALNKKITQSQNKLNSANPKETVKLNEDIKLSIKTKQTEEQQLQVAEAKLKSARLKQKKLAQKFPTIDETKIQTDALLKKLNSETNEGVKEKLNKQLKTLEKKKNTLVKMQDIDILLTTQINQLKSDLDQNKTKCNKIQNKIDQLRLKIKNLEQDKVY